MKNQPFSVRNTRYFVGSILLLTLLSIVVRALCILFFFDADLGYYTRGAWLPYLAGGIPMISVLALGILCFTRVGKLSLPSCKAMLASRICAIAVASAFLLLFLFGLFADGKPLPLLLSLGAAAYFALIFLDVASPSARLIGCVCAMLRLLLAMADVYFDVTVPMNAPDKVLFELACVVGVLFLISDLRASISEPRPTLFRFSLAAATILLGTASIPSLIGVWQGVLRETMAPSYLLLLALFVYALTRSVELLRIPNAPESSEPSPAALSPDNTND